MARVSAAPPHRRRLVVTALVLAMVSAACGSSHSREELIAATSGTAGPDAGATATAPQSGADESSGDDVDVPTTSPGAGPSVGSDGGGPAPVADGTASVGADGGAPPTDADAGGRQCTGDEEPLKIASVGQQSGVFGPFMLPITQGLQVWVNAANAAGGVACHPIELILRDDGGDPSVHQSEVQQLVEQENVIALVATTAVLTGNASLSYLTSKGVPVIGNEGGSEWTYDSPVYFPQLTTGNSALGALVGAIGKVGKPQGKSKLAVVTCLEAALCSSLFDDAGPLAAKAGLDLVYKAQASLTQPDFTSICQNAKSRGAEMMIIGLDTNSIQRVLRNCQSIGFDPLAITGGPLVTPALLDDPRADGFLVSSATDLYTNTGNPSVVEFRDAVGRFAPGLDPSIASLAGWTAGKLFEAGLESAPDATRAGLLEGLYSISDNDLGGLTYPLSFRAGQKPPRVLCVWIGQVKGGTLAPADGAPRGRTCE